MDFIQASILILFLATISVPIATRLGLPLEIFLVIGSALVSYIDGAPAIHLQPMVVFEVFLPPILFHAAYRMSWRDFKFNLRPILLLAVGLVIFTASAVAAAAVWIIPGFTWAEGFLLGAIVSPTDASSTTSIIRKFGGPKRLIDVLEGESLVNDATALTLYRFALIAILTQTFSLPSAILDFFMIGLGGAIAGIAVGYVFIKALSSHWIKDSRAESVFTFMAAFISYIVANNLGVSGVISTVVCGIYFGAKLSAMSSSEGKMYAKGSWATLMFVINGFVFTLLGFELPSVLKNLGFDSVYDLMIYGLVITFVVVFVRVFWVYPAAYIPRILSPSLAKRDPWPSAKFLFVLGWSGMRGIVSLAAVLALPHFSGTGNLFPHRDLMIFLTYFVIIMTLVLPSLSLPFLMRWFHLTETSNKVKEEALARIAAMKGVVEYLSQMRKKENIPESIYNEFLSQFDRKLEVIQKQVDENPHSLLTQDYAAIKKLSIAALQSERATLVHMRSVGAIDDEVFYNLLDELDLEDLRVKTLRA